MSNELIGSTIGPYTVIEQIGASDTATVFRARHNDPPHPIVAIKFLPILLGSDEGLRGRVAREMALAARLKHQHLLPVLEHGEYAGTPYVVMKLAEGGTLAAILQRDGALPLLTAIRVLDQIAGALDYAHSQGAVHGDIKPGNILFDNAGTAYLGDFGVARLQARHVTYAAPELCVGEDATPHSDLYALGAVLFEMLTGTPPFTGATRVAIMQQHIGEQPPDPAEHRPELPTSVSTVIRRALSKQPAGRYPTAEALSAGLKQALRSVLGPEALGLESPTVETVPDAVRDAPAPPASKSAGGMIQSLAPTRPTPPAARAQLQRSGKFPATAARHTSVTSAGSSTSQDAAALKRLGLIVFGVLIAGIVVIAVLVQVF